jgi:hypothetical protein
LIVVVLGVVGVGGEVVERPPKIGTRGEIYGVASTGPAGSARNAASSLWVAVNGP